MDSKQFFEMDGYFFTDDIRKDGQINKNLEHLQYPSQVWRDAFFFHQILTTGKEEDNTFRCTGWQI